MVKDVNLSTAYQQQLQQASSQSSVEKREIAVVEPKKIDTEKIVKATEEASERMKDSAEKIEEIKEAVEEMNKRLDNSNISRKFEYDNDLDRPILRVIDTNTQEIVKQMPTDEILDISRSIREMVGIITDSRI